MAETEHEAVHAWLDTPTWAASAAFLSGHPELLTDAAELALVEEMRSLQDRDRQVAVEEHLVLLRHARADGVEAAYVAWERRRAALTEATNRADAVLGRYRSGDASVLDDVIEASARLREVAADLSIRAQAATIVEATLVLDRYRTTGAPTDLEAAVALTRLAQVRRPVPGTPRYAQLVTDLVFAVRRQGDHERAVDLALSAVQSVAADSTVVAPLLAVLAEALRGRYGAGDGGGDLDAALKALDRALASVRPVASVLPQILDSRAGALIERYQNGGDAADLNAAVAGFTEAAESWPNDAQERAGSLTNLAGALLLRFDRHGADNDLDGATTALTDAIGVAAPDSPFLPAVYGRRAAAWLLRFRRTGERSFLDRAVADGEDAVRTARPDSRDRPSHLVALGQALQTRAEAGGSDDDADRAVEMSRQAVTETAPGAPGRRDRMHGLAVGLLGRFSSRGAAGDLSEAVKIIEDAARGAPPGAINTAGLLHNLGNGLWMRYQASGDLAALDRALSGLTRAVAMVEQGAVDGPRIRNSLAVALAERFGWASDVSDLRSCVAKLRDIVADTPEQSPEWATYAGNLGNALGILGLRSGDRGPLDEAVQVLRSALSTTLGANADDRHAALHQNLGSALARRFEVTGALNDLDAAEEQFRAAVTAQPSDAPALAGLGTVLRTRHDHTHDPRHVEEGVALLERACRIGLRSAPDTALRTARIWGQWAERREAYAEAARAFDIATRAAHRAFQAQALRTHRMSWVRLTGDLHVRAAWNHLAGDEPRPAAAVTALESGRAQLLSDALGQRGAEVDRLGRQYPELATGFGRAVERLGGTLRTVPDD